MQTVLVYITLIIAIFFLINKIFLKPKKKKGGCDTNCNC